jgi:hypothetical protein
MTFQVPTQTFTRKMADGTIGTVSRKGYTRRSTREDAWLYHLKELAASIGGVCTITAASPSGGTQVEWRIPVLHTTS